MDPQVLAIIGHTIHILPTVHQDMLINNSATLKAT